MIGEASQERKPTRKKIETMKQKLHAGIRAGALSFSVGNFIGQSEEIFGVKVSSSIDTYAERYEIGSVVGELGNGVFQVNGGAPGGWVPRPCHDVSRAVSIDRPTAMYDLLTQEFNNR